MEDELEVRWGQTGDGGYTVYVQRDIFETVTIRKFESYQYFEAKELAERIAEAIGCVVVEDV